MANLNTEISQIRNNKQGVSYVTQQHVYWDPLFPTVPTQGWKIHISCYFDNAVSILELVSSYCFQHLLSFKAVCSYEKLQYLLSKQAARSESGKFITIYPANPEDFAKTVRGLYPIIKKFHGPYILSDRRYLNAPVLYYRYGCIANQTGIMLDSLSHQYVDQRVPYYTHPDFVKDPLVENKESNFDSYLIKHYSDIQALHFSNSGGIYSALSRRGSHVIIKEARPYVGISEDNYSIICREREAKILAGLKEVIGVPRVFESFHDWENFYLVEQTVPGESLAAIISKRSIALFQHKDRMNVEAEYSRLAKIAKSLLLLVDEIHSHGVLINDINTSNFIVTNEYEVSCIDFEDANALSEHWPGLVSTNAGSNTDRNISKLGFLEQESQKLGYILMDMFSSANYSLQEDPSGETANRLFSLFCTRYGLPKDFRQVVESLIKGDTNLAKLASKIPFKVQKKCSELGQQGLSVPDFTNSSLDCQYFICSPALAALLRMENPNQNINNDFLEDLENLIQLHDFEGIERNIYEQVTDESHENLPHREMDEAILATYLYQRTQIAEYRQTAVSIIQHIYNQRTKQHGNEALVLFNKNVASPYVFYTAGLIRIALILGRDGNCPLSRESMMKLIRGIDRDFPKNWTYQSGLAGLIDTFICLLEDRTYQVPIARIRQKVQVLSAFIGPDVSQFKDRIFKSKQGQSFEFGIAGLQFVLARYLALNTRKRVHHDQQLLQHRQGL